MNTAAMLLSFLILLGACSTYVTPRYSISADTNLAIKTLGVSGVSVGAFSGPAGFDSTCRAAGPLDVPDGMSHSAYIKKALEDELKIAGAYGVNSPRVTLTGIVDRLAFSSSRGLTGGSWDIALKLRSSNGKEMSTSEHYEFKSGWDAITACKQTAEAFMPAVQNLIGKIVQSPEFKGLIQ